MTCPWCLAVALAPDDQLRTLVQHQAEQLNRLAQPDTFALKAAHVRIVELEDTVKRLNQRRTG